MLRYEEAVPVIAVRNHVEQISGELIKLQNWQSQ